jgi:hypothetical protein
MWASLTLYLQARLTPVTATSMHGADISATRKALEEIAFASLTATEPGAFKVASLEAIRDECFRRVTLRTTEARQTSPFRSVALRKFLVMQS